MSDMLTLRNQQAMKRLSKAIGDTRGQDFEAFVDLAEVIHNIEAAKNGFPEDTRIAAWVRMFKIMNIAFIETARIEHEAIGRDPGEIVVDLTTMAGECAAMLLASVVSAEGLSSNLPEQLIDHMIRGYRAAVDTAIEQELAGQKHS